MRFGIISTKSESGVRLQRNSARSAEVSAVWKHRKFGQAPKELSKFPRHPTSDVDD